MQRETNGAVDFLAMAHVAREGHGLVGASDSGASRFDAGGIARKENDACSVFNKQFCDRFADPHRRTCNDGDLSCEVRGPWAHRAFSNAPSKASSESERKRLRRMPRSTSARRSAADASHSKLPACASFWSSEAMSVLRTSCGDPESMNIRSCSK